ncbi:MAG: phosphoribosylformylglycinamidine synthase subunit PurQ [Coriobacteriia bacterium]|nr:phosphoribosylformylglycinamidine synthase subunit PurQ [Coriobacteriia bacterium]MBN2821776.1 phosphoribosylformylglycinamidine synthase subunit PurQ [Coriobacteriia bacterium]
MRFGVVIFPGSNCEQDVIHAARYLGHEAEYIWHGDTDLAGFDAVVLPGGFSYGDYIRCGAVARFSPVMAEVVRFAEAGGPVMGICNGFQILTEAHLLPGALLRNVGLKFICHSQPLRVEQSACQWLDLPAGTVVDIPVNHNEGNYICDAETLQRLKGNGQIVLRYCEPDGSVLSGSAPNGALDNIAGICNERGNVFGLMPHPERVVDPLCSGTDGVSFFNTIVQRLAEV